MQLYNYQAQAVQALLGGKHFVIAQTGVGKTAIGLSWAKATGKQKVLVVTTAAVRDAKNYETEAPIWCGEEWLKSLSLFTVVSWAGLAKWVQANWSSLGEYAVIADEVACMKSGVSSNRGKAFLQVTKHTDAWAGFTATPGDRWLDFYAYFTACGKVRNKTQFLRDFCIVQTFRGFPDIVGYRNEQQLRSWWAEISYVPDASQVLAELPPETNQTILFRQPTGYKQVVKTHETLDGQFLDNSSAFCHYLRQLCCSKEKLAWLAELVEGLGDSCLVFYTYTEEGDRIAEALRKKVGKVWRVDGTTHDVPTAETIGKHDVVIAQYQTGSMGLNLQFLNYCVFFSPNYAYSVSKQCKGRIRRIGQQKTCHYYFLRCRESIEDDVYKVLSSKRDFSEKNWLLGKGE